MNNLQQLYKLLLFFVFALFVHACTPSVPNILKALHQDNHPQAKVWLDKRREKLPQDPAIQYGYAVYYADSSNALFDLDTAYVHIQLGEELLSLSTPKTIAQLQKRNLNTSTFADFRKQLEKRAYRFFSSIHTEASYQEFLSRFPKAPQAATAIENRNKLAFATAEETHSYQSYAAFLSKYPKAKQARTARQRYEDLVFMSKTKTGDVASFVTFIQEHPDSPHRPAAERKIYHLEIGDYSAASYQNFIRKHPQNPYTTQAKEWLWYMDSGKSQLADSEQFTKRNKLKNQLLFPAFLNQKLCLVDAKGITEFETENATPLQLAFQGDVLIFEKENTKIAAINREGKRLGKGEYDALLPLHKTSLKARKDGMYAILHKGGFEVSRFVYDELEALNDEVLKFKQNGQWGLLTPNNQVILPPQFAHIQSVGDDLIQFEKYGQLAFVSKEKLTNPTFHYWRKEAIRWTHEQFIWLKKGRKWGVAYPTGEILLHPASEKLLETADGWAGLHRGEWRFYGKDGKQVFANRLEAVELNKEGYAIRKDGLWGLLGLDYSLKLPFEYDKISFVSGGISTQKGKIKTLHLADNEQVSLPRNANNVRVHPFKESHLYSFEDSTGRRGIMQGDSLLFAPVFENISPLGGEDVFLFQQNQKMGLIDMDSSLLVPAEYAQIVSPQVGYLALYQDEKFGLFHPQSLSLIPAQYDALLQKYPEQSDVLIAKQGKFGFISHQNKALTAFEFEQVRYWTQQQALVQKGRSWYFYSFAAQKLSQFSFEHFRILRQDEGEALLEIWQNGRVGWYSSRNQEIFPCRYAQILKLENGFYRLLSFEEATQSYHLSYQNAAQKTFFHQRLPKDMFEAFLKSSN